MSGVKISFKRQEYQQECISNIIEVLKDFDFQAKDNLSSCLDEFYKSHPELAYNKKDSLNLDILMETGTGKTFTYLNAIFEINKVYNQNKFIIFLPRKAILEGVKQNIKLSKNYFYEQYQKHLKLYEYSGNKNSLGPIVSHFIKNKNEFSVLILTNSSVDKESNKINKPDESLISGKSVFDTIAELNPICFIDEPHLLKGNKFTENFKRLNSIYFRFGATFPTEEEHKISNLIYALDSISAFRQYLVKQINVHTIVSQNEEPSLMQIQTRQKTATFSYFVDNIEYKTDVKLGDDLGEKLSHAPLKGTSITKFEAKKIYLSNKTFIELKEQKYHLSDAQINQLLAQAINLHFNKEKELFRRGIKSLSLFFIPNIADFRGENPKIKIEFERLYRQKRAEILKDLDRDDEYYKFLQKDFDKDGQLTVAGGYFSTDKGSSDEKEAEGVRLILKDKEELLSLQTPLRFIFSVWALQEGWDSPNIFTIAKLAHSGSEQSRHQQVGRGLRLCVNQNGSRQTYDDLSQNETEFYAINQLDVLINSAEKDFIQGLQEEINATSLVKNRLNLDTLNKIGLNQKQAHKLQEILETMGYLKFDEEQDSYNIISAIPNSIKENREIKNILGDKCETFFKLINTSNNKNSYVINANKAKPSTKIRANLANELKELWAAINKDVKIQYETFDENETVKNIADKFDKLQIHPAKISIVGQKFDPKINKFTNEYEKTIATAYTKLKHIEKILSDFAKKEDLPLTFVLKIYNSISKKEYFSFDTNKTLKELSTIIKDTIHAGIIESVCYKFSKTTITDKSPFNLLFDKDGNPKESILTHFLGSLKDDNATTSSHYLYDKVIYDSQIEKELIENDSKKVDDLSIKVFAKLPKFSIPTPYKSYEPDFAYVLEGKNSNKIFFICETKGYDTGALIPEAEQKKIDYAKKFFQKLQEQFKDINITFQTRINKESLLQALEKAINQESKKDN